MNDKELQLFKLYKKKLAQIPNWAFNYSPPMPFVGNNTNKYPKILIYGSAENLTYTLKGENHKIDLITPDEQIYRHRILSNNENSFPFIHMEPINNGSLLTISRYILDLLLPSNTFSNIPHNFLEEISVGNFGKFSIKNSVNLDYASSNDKLTFNLEFIKKDIQIIEPDIVIIPKTIFDSIGKEIFLKIKNELEINKEITFVLIKQITPTVINCHIKKELKNTEISKFPRNPYINSWIKLIKENSLKLDIESYLQWVYLKYIQKNLTISI